MEALAESTKQEASLTPPRIGELWPEQGGRYVGSYLRDGVVHHGIIAPGIESDIQASHNNRAEKIEGCAVNGFTDWRVPDQIEGMLTYIGTAHLPDEFKRKGFDSIYLTSTPFDSNYAWFVGFEDGDVCILARYDEFRFRPFRSVIY